MVLSLLLVQNNWLSVFIKLNELCVEHCGLEHLKFGHALDLEYNVLGLQVCVDDLADTMEVVKAHEDLTGDFAHNWHRYTLIVKAFDETEHVVAQNLESHDRMATILSMVEELVEHL